MYIFAAPVPHLSPTLINHDSFLFLSLYIFFVVYFLPFFHSAMREKRDCFCAGFWCLPAADGKQFNILIIQCHLKVLKVTRTFLFPDIYTSLSCEHFSPLFLIYRNEFLFGFRLHWLQWLRMEENSLSLIISMGEFKTF